MLNNEEGCIRYLMREMDPAEEIEFEREMLKDENLLIEVESLRKTYQKLGKLPLKHPPAHIVEQVVEKAVEQQKKKVQDSRIWVMNFSRAVASVAAAVLIVSAGVYFYNTPTENSGEQTQYTAEQEVNIQPWVDRNNVIQLVGTSTQPSMSESLQNDVMQSFQKLRLVNTETGFSPPSRKIVLTNVRR